MPFNSLTKVKEKFKLLTQLISLPKWVGPLMTLIAIALNQQAIQLGLFPPQVAWLYVPVAFSAVGGLRAGLVSAALVALYSIWLDPASIQRSAIVPPSVFALAALVGWQTRALRRALAEARAGEQARRMVDSLNGNIVRIEESRELILDILKNDRLEEKTRSRLRSVMHTMNNLSLATQGWKELRDLRADIDRAQTKPLGGASDESNSET